MPLSVNYNNALQSGGPYFVDGKLATNNRLISLILVSLGTDRVAQTGWNPTFPGEDRKGYWGDAYSDFPIGVRWWQLRRKGLTTDTLAEAETMANEALQWMVDQDLFASVAVTASLYGSNGIQIEITASEPSTYNTMGTMVIPDIWKLMSVEDFNAIDERLNDRFILNSSKLGSP